VVLVLIMWERSAFRAREKRAADAEVGLIS